MSNNLTVTQKIEQDYYKNKLSYIGSCNSTLEDRQFRKAYKDENERLYNLFKKESLEEYKLITHPCSEGIFDFAWQYSFPKDEYSKENTIENKDQLHEVLSILYDLRKLFY